MTKDKEASPPLISTGSMLNSSEGLLSTGACAALVQQMSTNDDWRVQAAACIGLAIVASIYCIMRQKAKAVE
jgi:hypothetical protein